MKILLINNYHYFRGGSETAYFALGKILEENGHQVAYFSSKNGKNEPSQWEKYFIEDSEFFDSKNSPRKKIRLVAKMFWNREAESNLKKLIEDFKPDIAHIHNFYHHLSPSILKVLRRFDVPVALTLHDYQPICPNRNLYNKNGICEKCQGRKFYNCAKNKCIRNSFSKSLIAALEAYFSKLNGYKNKIDIFLAPSRFIKSEFEKFGFKDKKIIYVPNFFMEGINESEKSEFEENYFLYAGRLEKEKGVDVLLKSLEFLDLKDYRLKIAGQGSQKEELKKLARELKVENKIDFLGFQKKEPLEELNRNARFIIIPSLWLENSPYAVLEALSSKKATVASYLGGIPEIVKDWENGLTFTPGEPKDLAQKIEFLINNPREAEKMGENAKERLKEQFDRKKTYEMLIKAYEYAILRKAKIS